MAERAKKTKLVILKPHSLVWQISAKLTQAILGGDFVGGQQMVETELQKLFGVSRSPIREALRDLEKKGLVEIIPRRGTFLKKITPKDVEEIFPVRAALEGLAAREACFNLTKEDYDQLEQTVQGLNEGAANENPKLFLNHHEKFHATFIHASKNNVLIRILENLLLQSKWVLLSLYFPRHLAHCIEDLQLSLRLHQEIFELLKDKDEKKVEDKVKRHIEIAALSIKLSINEIKEKKVNDKESANFLE